MLGDLVVVLSGSCYGLERGVDGWLDGRVPAKVGRRRNPDQPDLVLVLESRPNPADDFRVTLLPDFVSRPWTLIRTPSTILDTAGPSSNPLDGQHHPGPATITRPAPPTLRKTAPPPFSLFLSLHRFVLARSRLGPPPYTADPKTQTLQLTGRQPTTGTVSAPLEQVNICFGFATTEKKSLSSTRSSVRITRMDLRPPVVVDGITGAFLHSLNEVVFTSSSRRNSLAVTHPSPAPLTPFTHLIPLQSIAVLSSFTLESGVVLHSVPVAYRTWGRLSSPLDAPSNCMVICHALTGSSDVEDWWGPLMGPSLAFDPTRYFIFCANVLGSPYGTASPVTIDPSTGEAYGPEFPSTTTRDDVRLQEIVLKSLGVHNVAVVIGGSMGGMAVLEYPLSTRTRDFVRHVVPIATSPRHSAWGISWGEAQRQSIYSDPKYCDGYYVSSDPPSVGLAAARMAALLTYRSRDSFESRFGRKEMEANRKRGTNAGEVVKELGWVGNGVARTPAERALAAHNDGHRLSKNATKRGSSTPGTPVPVITPAGDLNKQIGFDNPRATSNGASSPASTTTTTITTPGVDPIPHDRRLVFSAQSYLRYQGDKFVGRFDANCYIHLTRKMDAHDVDRDRGSDEKRDVPAGALVVAVSSDGLFTLSEQQELADRLPGAQMVVVQSPDGHDGFLLGALPLPFPPLAAVSIAECLLERRVRTDQQVLVGSPPPPPPRHLLRPASRLGRRTRDGRRRRRRTKGELVRRGRGRGYHAVVR